MQRLKKSHYNRDGSVKVGYKTGHQAVAAIGEMRQKVFNQSRVFDFYPCKKCGNFHIGVNREKTKTLKRRLEKLNENIINS